MVTVAVIKKRDRLGREAPKTGRVRIHLPEVHSRALETCGFRCVATPFGASVAVLGL